MRKRSLLHGSIVPLLIAMVFSAATLPANAEEVTAAPSGLVAPRLIHAVSPEYPETKRATAESAHVVLTLTLDAAGAVTGVSIASSGGAEFDRSAMDSARKLTFSPALRDGKPIPARIPFSFDFAHEKPAPAAIAVAALGGKVTTPIGEPLPGAVVTVTSGTRAPLTATTDTRGGFRFDGLAPGKYHVVVVASGLAPYAADEELAAGDFTEITYRPRLARIEDASAPQELEVVGERPPREVTRRVLEEREIAKMPGTNGDALRSLESMPGVARSADFASQLIVRGAGPDDTAVFVDGTPIPIAYHFGGLTSVVPAEVLSRIDFTPGNFGAEYGRVMGGIIDVGLRSPRKDRWGGLLQIDVLDGRVVAEGPLGGKTRLLVAARRSWVDA